MTSARRGWLILALCACGGAQPIPVSSPEDDPDNTAHEQALFDEPVFWCTPTIHHGGAVFSTECALTIEACKRAMVHDGVLCERRRTVYCMTRKRAKGVVASPDDLEAAPPVEARRSCFAHAEQCKVAEWLTKTDDDLDIVEPCSLVARTRDRVTSVPNR